MSATLTSVQWLAAAMNDSQAMSMMLVMAARPRG
jgi:hypothetical protein